MEPVLLLLIAILAYALLNCNQENFDYRKCIPYEYRYPFNYWYV